MLADGDAVTGGAEGLDVGDRRAAVGGRYPAIRHRAIERAGDVRQDHRCETEGLDRLPHGFDVADREMAGRKNDETLGVTASRLPGQRLDRRRDGGAPALLDRAAEVGSLGQHHAAIAEDIGAATGDRGEIGGEVLAARFHQRRGADADQLRVGAGPDVEKSLFEVIGTAEHRRYLVHRRRLDRDGFLEMADEQHQREGRAALAAMEERHGPFDAEKGIGGAKRLRRLQRIGGEGADFIDRHDRLLSNRRRLRGRHWQTCESCEPPRPAEYRGP